VSSIVSALLASFRSSIAWRRARPAAVLAPPSPPIVPAARRRSKPVWKPSVDCEPTSEAFVARCLLGAGWVAGNRKLSMHDLRIWAALLTSRCRSPWREPLKGRELNKKERHLNRQNDGSNKRYAHCGVRLHIALDPLGHRGRR
jgi:hypothetical protein